MIYWLTSKAECVRLAAWLRLGGKAGELCPKKTINQMNSMRHYIAINSYRSSTSDGFSNTWTIYRCSRKDMATLLSDGLPVRDACGVDGNGNRYPISSTMGIRQATRKEIRALLREESCGVRREVFHVSEGECAGWNFTA